MSLPVETAHDPHHAEPLGLVWLERPLPEGFDSGHCWRFELSSRGDRVPGRLLLPSAPPPHPLVLLQHGAGGSIDSPYMQACAPWVRGGAAVASIDFPLHGERVSAKLTERLLTGLGAAERHLDSNLPTADTLLFVEFARQAVADLGRTLTAVGGRDDIDADRVAYAGFSLGGILGALFCAHDPRPRAAALALAGGGFGPAQVDPCNAVARIAPRPLLMVNARHDATVPAAASEKLFAAAGEPKRIEWFDTDHSTLPGRALKEMWSFLRQHLGIDG
ncbi:MAG: alpha/beta hydrolase family protein [Myxococcota bacterium]